MRSSAAKSVISPVSAEQAREGERRSTFENFMPKHSSLQFNVQATNCKNVNLKETQERIRRRNAIDKQSTEHHDERPGSKCFKRLSRAAHFAQWPLRCTSRRAHQDLTRSR